jgi:deazaflavin-dependent oxidoreductase (nitroreductase family)
MVMRIARRRQSFSETSQVKQNGGQWTMIPLTEQNSPRGLQRWLSRLPIWVYRARLGWLFGERLLLLTHVGRRSGMPRQTVLEVVHHDTARDTYFIASGWGERSDWLRNVEKTSNVKVNVGKRRFEAIAGRVPILEGQRTLISYARRHPSLFQTLTKLMVGRRLQATEKDCLALAQSVPVLALVPVRKASANFSTRRLA